MNLTMLMKFGEGIENAAMGEKAAFGLQVIGIGMGVVFGVLILLIGVLQLFKLFAIKKTLDEKSTDTAPVVASTAPIATATVAPSSDEEKIVAVATAAIAASRGESECAFNVISIKKIVK